jgi:diadenosine tetraphosphatase ApaH/serine/threonine PP2A family protein phosphatase
MYIKTFAKTLIDQIISSRVSQSHLFVPNFSGVLELVRAAKTLLDDEPVLLILSGARCIVGDIHGNIDGLLRIFDRCHYPPDTSYLFLGDYVDRGSHSCEVILLLYALKVLWPHHVHLLRGNHEFGELTETFGFRRECLGKLSTEIYNAILDSFDSLPLAAIHDENLCVHGGISPYIQNVDDLNQLEKKVTEYGNNSASDLLWSDPRIDVEDYDENPRGCGQVFGPKALEEFLARTGTSRLIRAHENCQKGFDYPFRSDIAITIFSTPDYCQLKNNGAVAMVSADGTIVLEHFQPCPDINTRTRRLTFPRWNLSDGHHRPIRSELANCNGMGVC